MRIDLIERFLSYTLQPISHFLRSLWHHPVDTVVDNVVSVGEFVQENPLTCAAIVGLGAYAHHRRWLRFGKYGIGVHIEPETPIGGAMIHSSFYLGNKKKAF